MPSVTEGVNFDTVAREWRMKWSSDNGSKSLQEAQKALDAVLPIIKALDGFKSVQRVVCGGCLDFKVVISLNAEKYGPWGESAFAPEESFLAAVKAIEGITVVETQTYTLMTL
mmetsp:Transcript_5060/g.5184  ORF Transcript_5060/g.5184 Transcript_5060/m.5184 type:complete len:113 (+) Transcript_5060:70-408(+)|eukprot:CAMPEP_0119034374 /NCGR_PEP_ID=MMETSP1177-20130426/1363_1 /TAXON_ID=2985 /ORGANISM="Ochromonas sp, Strain CCMP1899" /LENGTH=112 /DNA_ID=CAMNT_0006991765 /DNA_START=69 /DNA_END=407 /DNA_ORIENTATION=+